MSGIVGIISQKKKDQLKQDIVIKMLGLLKHRGCFYKQIFDLGNVCIGCTSNDINVFYNKDKTIYLFLDGIIYNYSELKSIFSLDYDFNDTDSYEKIILFLYEKYGIGSFEFINGDYAFVIWDSIKQVLVLSKYMNIDKNIYYYNLADCFIFSSEIKSLLVYPDINRDIDYESINNFLTFRHIPSPHTIFKNIKRLGALSVMTYDGKPKEKRISYFKVDKNYRAAQDSVTEEISLRLEDALLKRLNRIGNAGLFLSGGLDSSALLYFLTRNTKDSVNTYTAALLRDGPFARRVSDFYNCQHTEHNVSEKDLINVLPKALWNFEYPVNGPDSFLYYLPEISKKQKYVFWGRGAEELFYSRSDYMILNSILQFKKIMPSKISNLIQKYSHEISNRNKICRLLNVISSDNIYDIYIAFREIFTKPEKQELLDDRILKYNIFNRVISFGEFAEDFLQKYSFLTLANGFWSDTFLASDQYILNPYMDKDFISYMYSIPSKFKIQNYRSRYLLEKTMFNRLPSFIINRKKDDWHAQTKAGVNREIKNYYHIINRLRDRGILKNDILDFFEKCHFRVDEKFWSLLSLEVLLEIFLDKNKMEEPPRINEF
jgi:asparagine synthase (glutamine-hydrolysing)